MYKVMIADDEMLVCKSLEKTIHENYRNISILPFASNGIELITNVEKNLPDIIAVDINMPGMNGLDAVDIILKKYPKIKIIVVTAYSRFDYAHKALTLGASDYLLKPIKAKDFLSTLQKILDQIDQERKEATNQNDLQRFFDNYQNAVENEFFTELLLGEIREESLKKYMEFLPHPLYGAYILSVRPVKTADGISRQSIYENFLQDLKKICTCCGRTRKNILILCVLSPLSVVENLQKNWLINTLNCVISQRPYFHQLCIGASSFKFAAQSFPEGVRESHIAIPASPGVCFDIPTVKKTRLPSHEDILEQLLTAASQEQYETITDKLQNIILQSEASGESIQIIKLYTLNLTRCIIRELPIKKSTSPTCIFFSWMYWEKILFPQNCQDLSKEISDLFEHLQGSNEAANRYNRHMVNSLHYISQHYAEDLSLENVADENHLSVFYLSRLFKQELNHTFLEILTDLRLSIALELLFTTNCSAQEISEKCGYLNTTYFYKLFKKRIGITIGEMRNLISMLP